MQSKIYKFLFLFLLSCLAYTVASAQTITRPNGKTRLGYTNFVADSSFQFFTGCDTPDTLTGFLYREKKAAIYYDSCAHQLMIFDPALNEWRVSGGTVQSDLVTLQKAIENGNITSKDLEVILRGNEFSFLSNSATIGGNVTMFGALVQPQSAAIPVLNELHVPASRTAVTLTKRRPENVFKTLSDAGKKVVLTINYNGLDQKPFPTLAQMPAYCTSFDSLCNVLENYSIPIVTGDNEENNLEYRPQAKAADIIREIDSALHIAHRHGLQFTNGGLTGPQMLRKTWKWMMDNGFTTEATAFANYEFGSTAGLSTWNTNPTFSRGANLIDSLVTAYATLGIDKVNVHYYAARRDTTITTTDTTSLHWIKRAYEAMTGKGLMTNEIGQYNVKPLIPPQMLQWAVINKIPYFIWYSGDGSDARALQNPDNSLRPNGTAFASFNASYALADTTTRKALSIKQGGSYFDYLIDGNAHNLGIDANGRVGYGSDSSSGGSGGLDTTLADERYYPLSGGDFNPGAYLGMSKRNTEPPTPTLGFTNFYFDSLCRPGYKTTSGFRRIWGTQYPGHQVARTPYKAVTTFADSADIKNRIDSVISVIGTGGGSQNLQQTTDIDSVTTRHLTVGSSSASLAEDGAGMVTVIGVHPNNIATLAGDSGDDYDIFSLQSQGADNGTTNLTVDASSGFDVHRYAAPSGGGAVLGYMTLNNVGNLQISPSTGVYIGGTSKYLGFGDGTYGFRDFAGTMQSKNSGGVWTNIGSGSGGTNSNIGSGYRLAVPYTNNIKTLFAGTFITLDSSSNTNGITAKVDTTTGLHTLNYYNTIYQQSGNYVTIGGAQALTGVKTFPAATTSNPSFIMPAGVAPTSPLSGYEYSTGTHRYWVDNTNAAQQLDNQVALAGILNNFATGTQQASSSFSISNTGTFGDSVTINKNSIVTNIGANARYGLRVNNATAATSGVPLQYSPMSAMTGAAYASTPASSMPVTFAWQVQPIAGTTTVTGELDLFANFNGNTQQSAMGIAKLMKITHAGDVTFNGTVTATANVIAGTGNYISASNLFPQTDFHIWRNGNPDYTFSHYKNTGNILLQANGTHADPAARLAINRATTPVGTISVSAGTTVSGGSGTGITDFQNTFRPGDTITCTTSAGSESRVVSTISSNVNMSVTVAFTGSATNATYTTTARAPFKVKDNGKVSIYNVNISDPSGYPEYADNAAAIAGGLVAGDLYKTGDFLKVVH